ncbi:MAG TPA: hypothetical protein VFD69_19260 [Vicinamibacterales bacterium]|nr:hypothetical protein [Vicinamibacterales bacterium]
MFTMMTVFGTPIVLGLAWWRWIRGGAVAAMPWRERSVLVGLVAASLNLFLFYSWFAYRFIAGATEEVWAIKGTLGDGIAGCLVIAAILGALVGKGRGRVLTAVGATMAYLLWVPTAIL